MESMYRLELLELYSNRENYGELLDKTHEVRHKNPICNDEIIIDLVVKDNKVIDAKFRGISCFVTTVASEVLMDFIKGKSVDEIKKITKKDVDKMLGIDISSARVNCELLPLEALKKLK